MTIIYGAATLAGCGGSTRALDTDSPPGGAGGAEATDPTPIASAPTPPRAEARPHEVPSPHGTRVDPYYWLRDDTRSNPEVLAYLRAENEYTEQILAPTRALQETLYQELVGRIQEDDSTVPVFDDGYWYYVRYEQGKQYPISARKKTLEGPEEVLIDGNQRAEGHAFYALGSVQVSKDGHLMAFAEDTVGRNQFVLRFKDLRTGQILPDEIPNVSGGAAWAGDNRTVLYTQKDPTTLRPHLVKAHTVGTPIDADRVLHDEKDETFGAYAWKSKSDQYLFIAAGSTETSEVLYARADDPKLVFRSFQPRERGHRYSVEHSAGRFVVVTNWQAKNYRIMEAPAKKLGDKKVWKEIVPHRDDVFIHGVEPLKEVLAISERSGGLRKIRIRRWKDGSEFFLDAEQPAYTMYLSSNPDPNTTKLRYVYTSPTTPSSTYDYDLATGAKELLKREPVLGDFDPDHYVAEYIEAPARDGETIPVTIVYRKGTPLDGTAPLYQYGYGSYGITMDPTFSRNVLSLLDRGFVYAIAHVRGGQEKGRRWYEDGRQLKKLNTFYDFIDVTEHLVAKQYGAPDKVLAAGGSAGGLLMGAVVNLRPDLYRGVIAWVPFVDVVTTMLDDAIPLTTGEFDEWGDPKVKEFYDYILAYSPYDNVKAQAYPAMLVATGLWDSQVQYFEPAKWVAKLRATKTDDRPLLLHTNMDAGHGGKSGRYERLRETARDYAFLLHVLGRSE